MSTRALFAVVERCAGATIPLRALETALLATRPPRGESAAAMVTAARAAGIVRDAPPATTVECPGIGCARDVRKGERKGARRLLGVCTRDPSECATVKLEPEDLAQVAVSIEGVAATLRKLFAIAASAPRARGSAGARAVASEPMLLGEDAHAGIARDVFLVVHPARTALASFLALRERAARPTLVLTPTPDAIAPDLATRYAPGAHVELAILSDALAIRDAAIVLATPRLRLVRPAPAPAPVRGRPLPPSMRHRLPVYASWSDLHLRLADGVTLLVTVGRTSVRLSYFDLGLAHGNTRDTTLGWRVMRAVCNGHGTWDWRLFGDKDTVPQLMSELQKTLMAAFDLKEKPFKRLTRSKGYVPAFRASPGPGGDNGKEEKDEGGWSG